jgi:hypothetical protein
MNVHAIVERGIMDQIRTDISEIRSAIGELKTATLLLQAETHGIKAEMLKQSAAHGDMQIKLNVLADQLTEWAGFRKGVMWVVGVISVGGTAIWAISTWVWTAFVHPTPH